MGESGAGRIFGKARAGWTDMTDGHRPKVLNSSHGAPWNMKPPQIVNDSQHMEI